MQARDDFGRVSAGEFSMGGIFAEQQSLARDFDLGSEAAGFVREHGLQYAIRGRQVVLDVDGRGEKGVAARVEPFASAAVGWEQIFDTNLDAEKIADGVFILRAIDAAAHDVTAIKIGGAIRGELTAIGVERLGQGAE